MMYGQYLYISRGAIVHLPIEPSSSQAQYSVGGDRELPILEAWQ
jgi:hypothetical protein